MPWGGVMVGDVSEGSAGGGGRLGSLDSGPGSTLPWGWALAFWPGLRDDCSAPPPPIRLQTGVGEVGPLAPGLGGKMGRRRRRRRGGEVWRGGWRARKVGPRGLRGGPWLWPRGPSGSVGVEQEDGDPTLVAQGGFELLE